MIMLDHTDDRKTIYLIYCQIYKSIIRSNMSILYAKWHNILK